MSSTQAVMASDMRSGNGSVCASLPSQLSTGSSTDSSTKTNTIITYPSLLIDLDDYYHYHHPPHYPHHLTIVAASTTPLLPPPTPLTAQSLATHSQANCPDSSSANPTSQDNTSKEGEGAGEEHHLTHLHTTFQTLDINLPDHIIHKIAAEYTSDADFESWLDRSRGWSIEHSGHTFPPPLTLT